MNKSAIKNFAIWARRKLISDITYKAGLLGITDKGIKDPLVQSTKEVQFFDIGTKEPYQITGKDIEKRVKLVNYIKEKEEQSDYSLAYKTVIEEVAYTWFNRLIAIRFMEVNEYLPSKIRVLSSQSKTKLEPDIVTMPFDTDLEYTDKEKTKILSLINENKQEELFKLLFIKQCNALNTVLPALFEKTTDFTELLLNISFTDREGLVYHLVNDIEEEDFKEAVEIIGWMYQYYNEERKNEVINIYKGTIKKEDIPAATQLFTTDWVVRYMVDNSLGRYWIERNPQSKLAEKLDFFATPKDDKIQYVDEKINPEEITFFDSCMGSGHILVYAFDVFMEIYKELGYSERDASQLIITNNLYGLDIDDRAYQLAYFALMMKARSYDRRFLNRNIEPNISPIFESNNITEFSCEGITNNKEQNYIGEYLVKAYKHAKEIGSLLNIEKNNYKDFYEYLENLSISGQLTMESDYWNSRILPIMKKLTKQALIMSDKYSVVCTNPPYMNKLEGELKKYVTKEYKEYSGDLFSVFMYKNFDYCKPNGYSGFMTPFVWMFIKTYEKLREYIINNKSITTLVQMEYSAFEEATVPICSFVLKNGKEKEKGLYFKLSDFKGGMKIQREKVLEAIENKDCGYFYETSEEDFSKIPGSPIAYWVSEKIYNMFIEETIQDISSPRFGMSTANNEKFVRTWMEVNFKKMSLPCDSINCIDNDKKWYPYNNGGEYRRWYGNNIDVVNWEKSGKEIKETGRATIRNERFYFNEGLTWTSISSSKISVRAFNFGFLFSSAGFCIFESKYKLYIISLLNNKIGRYFLSVLSPTLNYNVGDIARIPIVIDMKYQDYIENLSQINIIISKTDWDSFETSWDFRKHPLIDEDLLLSNMDDSQEIDSGKDLETSSEIEIFFDTGVDIVSSHIETSYEIYRDFTERQFNKLKSNEEELNRIFIEIYGLEDELKPYVEDKDVTVYRVFDSKDAIPDSMKGSRYALTKQDVIKSFISYAVGCMFGRYSLDVEGLAYAGGDWDDSKYSIFTPDKENIIPITDEEYFKDDIVGLFVSFVKKVYGENTLEENLEFIADALDIKGNTPREIIRNYFIKDFFKDHVKTYQKRPIYWMFDSGKSNGFKALIYLHRYDENTIGNLRIDYLHRIQRVYDNEIKRMQDTIDNSQDAREKTLAQKRKEKLIKQLKETKEYDEKIAHLALARISLDLDDGVKVNYEKLHTDKDGKKLQVLAKI